MYHIELLGKDGKPVPDGEIGEVCIVPKDGKRPLGVFCAYLDNEERYQEVWRGGVYHTGDAVWRDEDGYYWFHGRFDDIIKSRRLPHRALRGGKCADEASGCGGVQRHRRTG